MQQLSQIVKVFPIGFALQSHDFGFRGPFLAPVSTDHDAIVLHHG
jgi:hypothetical protein